MIAFLRGQLEHKGIEDIIVDVHGVGYKVYVTRGCIDNLGEVNSEVKIHTHLVHKEDNMQLFGFASLLERELFTLLISVSGIGPKMGLALLSSLSVSEIVYSVISNSPKALAQAHGVGQKTAQRIALELKEKLTAWKHLIVPQAEKPQVDETVMDETKTVLKALGYIDSEISAVLSEISGFCKPGTKEEDIIKMALEKLSNI